MLTTQVSIFLKTLCEFSFYVYFTMPFLPSFFPSSRTWSPQSCFNTSRSSSSTTTSIKAGSRTLPPYSRYHHKKGYTLIHIRYQKQCTAISASMPKSHQAKHVAMCPRNTWVDQRDATNRIANVSGDKHDLYQGGQSKSIPYSALLMDTHNRRRKR